MFHIIPLTFFKVSHVDKNNCFSINHRQRNITQILLRKKKRSNYEINQCTTAD
ncbi:unnamed protein product [Paramecium octaurelia]|uniref:Uncharacterized protein n=1 Tax=Paramecium octaurelia TaxID=43137 RepID=A0A8S1YMM6_PAROT|nr:unnamed protein product [Paramecium octaurelia]